MRVNRVNQRDGKNSDKDVIKHRPLRSKLKKKKKMVSTLPKNTSLHLT